jgi:bis(5'-nucleosyl)-tetraphosphatase (symmetrical)
MALYLIGDIQGCNAALGRLLECIDFSPSRDTACFLGDLVNRGPDSLGVLERLIAMGDAARCILGNHDLHLLAVAHGIRAPHSGDTLEPILNSTHRQALLDWLRAQPLARMESPFGKDLLLVHAGVLPAWTAQKTLALAGEVEAVLRSDGIHAYLQTMYGNTPPGWSDGLQGADRLRVVVNALTRLRYCSAAGEMEFASKETQSPPGYLPWFDVPHRQSADHRVAFGHWSTLGWLDRQDVACLDSGCVWGGVLTALALNSDGSWGERVQVPNPDGAAPLA